MTRPHQRIAAICGLPSWPTCETVGLVLFSIGTQVSVAPAIVAMIASTFTLIPLVFGVLRLGEQPAANQWIGVSLVMIGLILLGIKPV